MISFELSTVLVNLFNDPAFFGMSCFNHFLLIDATDRSNICGDGYEIQLLK